MIQQRNDGVVLDVRVTPRASRTQFVGIVGNELYVRVNAAPVNNAANEAVVRALAELFDVSRSSVVIVAGNAGRSKQVLLRGMTVDDAKRRLNLVHAEAPPPV